MFWWIDCLNDCVSILIDNVDSDGNDNDELIEREAEVGVGMKERKERISYIKESFG